MAHRDMAVSRTRGRTASLVGPGTSFRMSALPPAPSCPRIATNSTTIPMPPSQCVKHRQNNTLRGSVAGSSSSPMTDAPVVVKPLMDSNRHSTAVMRMSGSRSVPEK